MRYIFLITICLFSNDLFSQNNKNKCEEIYFSAESLFTKGEYSLAINKISAYKICAATKDSKKADALLLKIYSTVNRQKEDAIVAKKDAEKQAKLANQRAATIQMQRDSIQKENIANQIATQALQVNQIDPNKALKHVYTGFCYNPNNTSLNEIRRKIFTDEILFKEIEGANPYNTVSIAKLNSNIFYTGDSDGEIKLWDALNFKLIDKIKVFKNSLSLCQRINDNSIIVYGNDSKDFKNPNYSVKILDITKKNSVRIISDSLKSNIISIISSYEENTFLFSSENGDIFKLEAPSLIFNKFKTIEDKIVGMQCWTGAKKIFYATPKGVFDLFSNQQYYSSPLDVFITYFGFCNSTGDFYIGFGEDLLLFNVVTQKDHLLYPIHKSMITSCSCADSTGSFLTTSLDGIGVLWTSNGNLSKALKGNKAELYSGYLDPNQKFALTVGRRELNSSQSDTSTFKYWFLSNLLEEKKEAHLFGAKSVVYAEEFNYVISGGNNGEIKIWDESLNFIESKQINSSGISTLFWDGSRKKLWFGTFDGNTGNIELSEKGEMISNKYIRTHTGQVSSILADPSGKVYSVGKDGVLFIQDKGNNRIDSVYFDKEIAEISFSSDYSSLLIAAADKVILYELRTRKKIDFQHSLKVNSMKWLNKTMFASVSGQFLRIWSINNNIKPILKADNNIRNIMTSLHIDTEKKLIYTGTWSGYIFCWDFYGKQLFEFDQLTSLADTNIINSICGSHNNSYLYSVDYNGYLAKWYSPNYFINKQLNIKSNCQE